MPDRIYLDKRDGSPNWYIYHYHERTGECPRISTRTGDRGAAEKKLAQYILSTQSRVTFTDPTLVEVLLRYWELHGKKCFGKGAVKTVMGIVAEDLPRTKVSEFTRTAQKEWADSLDVSTATRKRYLGVIQTALTFVHDREELAELPKFYRVKVDGGTGAKPLSIAYLRSLCDAAVDGPRMFMALAIGTLSRPNAILDLTWDRVDFEHNVIRLHNPERKKTKKVRPTVPMGPALRAFLWEHRSVGYVVQKPNGQRYGYHRTMFNRLKEKAERRRSGTPEGAAKVTGSAYGIRKAGAAWLRAQGVPELDLKGMLGHRMPGVTETYAEYDPRYMRAAADATDALLRAVNPAWMRDFLATDLPVQAVANSETPGKDGAGNEARTRDLNLGKEAVILPFPRLRAANDD